MSHEKIVITEYQDADVLAQALQEAAAAFGFTVQSGRLTARMYNGNAIPVDFRIASSRSNSTGFYYGDFGLTRGKNGMFSIVIDDLDEKRERVQGFLAKLIQCYGYHKTVKEYEAQGWIISREAETTVAGDIRFKMRLTRRVLEVQTTNTEKQPAQVAVWR